MEASAQGYLCARNYGSVATIKAIRFNALCLNAGQKPRSSTPVEVMLAGLASDGGLYVPETWPALSEKVIAGFAGRPYAGVAVEVISPLSATVFRSRSRPHGAQRPYGSSAIRRLRRWCNSATACSCLSCFTGRRSPSRIWRCNCWRA